MSSRRRRSMTLKHFDKHFRRGLYPSANTSGIKPETTQTSEAEDTPTGSAPSATGTPGAPSSGQGLASSLDRRFNFSAPNERSNTGERIREELARLYLEAVRPPSRPGVMVRLDYGRMMQSSYAPPAPIQTVPLDQLQNYQDIPVRRNMRPMRGLANF